MRIYVPLALLLLYSSHAFAIFCPTNFSNIDLGNTIQQVQEVCGTPTSVNQYQKTKMSNQIWNYYIRAPGLNQNMAKMSVLFRNDEVMNIHLHYNSEICPLLLTKKNGQVVPPFCIKSINDEDVASTNLCGGFIQVGNNAQAVQYACGQPAVIQAVPGTETQPVDVTELHYDGPPKATLIFENGQLIDRQFR